MGRGSTRKGPIISGPRAIQLWLDDERPAPEGWVHAKTLYEAILHFEDDSTDVVEASLDHDLGDGIPSGYDVVKWIRDNDAWPSKVTVHSMNPVGARNIMDVLRYDSPLLQVGPKTWSI